MKKLDSLVNDSVTGDIANSISPNERKRLQREILYMVGALVSLFAGLIYKSIYPDQEAVLGFIYLIGVLIIGLPILFTAVKGLVKDDVSASMEILVAVAIIVCVIDNQYVLALLIPIILTLVHFLEEKSIVGGREAIESLKNIQSNTALLVVDGEEREVNVQSVKIGDVIVIKPGMSVPVDGIVISGVTSINQQSLTGESQPVYVEAGGKVFAGTINIEGAVTVKVEKEYKDSSLQQIVTLLEKTQNITVAETKTVDKFLKYYIPITLIIAIMIWLFTKDISRAIAILVVSCPCGHMLVSSAPMLSAFATATKRGILIKNSNFINKLGDVNCMVFDKTGTITNGTLEVVDYVLLNAHASDELIEVAGKVACGSLHPVSRSIAALSGTKPQAADYEITEVIGKGVEGKCGEDSILIGNTRWLKELGFDMQDDTSADGAVTWVVKNGEVLGGIVLRDMPRSDAAETVAELKKLGVSETVLLTGDKTASASRVKEAVGLDTMYAQMLPEEKLQKVSELKDEKIVAVIGDGINDALALSEADVGIAMGAMGSETAIQSADIALMSNNLSNIPFVIKLARKTKSIVLQNIVIAFSTSFLMIVLAATGLVNALLGSILHNIGAFLILFNSGRLLKK